MRRVPGIALWVGLVIASVPAGLVAEDKSVKADGTKKPTAAKAVTRGIMHSIFNPVTELLALSMDEDAFLDPKNKKRIERLMTQLATNAGALREHAGTRVPAFQYVSMALARDARDIEYWFHKGRYDEARFLLHNITENCISCHSAHPGKRDFPGAGSFFGKVKVAKLSQLEKAQLQVATRQFDEALQTYESMFRAKNVDPVEVATTTAIVDYLKVAIRVKNDLQRPVPVLDELRKRKGMPKAMATQLAGWIRSLQDLQKQKLMGRADELATAKKLVSMAEGNPRSDRVIYFIAASGLLNRVVSSAKYKPEVFAQAYYLLGVCESVIGRSFWLSQTENFLESAIRSAPGTSLAQKSYKMLEEHLVGEFSGSSGTYIPPDVKALLAELKDLAHVKKNTN